MGQLGPVLSKKCDLIANLEATPISSGLNEGHVEIEETYCIADNEDEEIERMAGRSG